MDSKTTMKTWINEMMIESRAHGMSPEQEAATQKLIDKLLALPDERFGTESSVPFVTLRDGTKAAGTKPALVAAARGLI